MTVEYAVIIVVLMLVYVKMPEGFEIVGVIVTILGSVIVTVEGDCGGRVGNSVVNGCVRESLWYYQGLRKAVY